MGGCLVGGFCRRFPIFGRTLANSICLLPEDLIKKVQSMQTKFLREGKILLALARTCLETGNRQPQRIRCDAPKEAPGTWQTSAEHLLIIAHHQRQIQ